jgi:hypothetical protein
MTSPVAKAGIKAAEEALQAEEIIAKLRQVDV